MLTKNGINNLQVLLLEPYYGGSHQQFIDGLVNSISADFTIFHLPARKWKMRMQLSACWFAEKIAALPAEKRRFDTVLCSSFMDLAVFISLVQKLAGWSSSTRYLTYYHENQFHYPGYLQKASNHQFTAINFNNALVSEAIAFNSKFNRQGFLTSVATYLKKATDMNFADVPQKLGSKATVIYPGIDFTLVDSNKISRDCSVAPVPLIVWNHRWEHDKDPETFFKSLDELKKREIDFRLVILGQQFSMVPQCFVDAPQRFSNELLHIGFLSNKNEYYDWLKKGDIIVSTAHHEFFGIAVIEAVRAGCYPVLPDRLAYPELFPEKYLYKTGGLSAKLAEIIVNNTTLEAGQWCKLTEPFSWHNLKARYWNWLTGESDHADQ